MGDGNLSNFRSKLRQFQLQKRGTGGNLSKVPVKFRGSHEKLTIPTYAISTAKPEWTEASIVGEPTLLPGTMKQEAESSLKGYWGN